MRVLSREAEIFASGSHGGVKLLSKRVIAIIFGEIEFYVRRILAYDEHEIST